MIEQAVLATINHLLAQSGWARTRLVPHAGRTAHLDLAPVHVGFSVANDGYLAQWAHEGEQPDVRLRVAATELLPDLVARGPAGVMQRVHLEGNAEFADALGFVFRNLRWDAEEDLSRVVGDILAHRAVTTARALVAGQQRAAANAAANVAEFLTAEERLLLGRPALGGFTAEIVDIRDQLGRLDKRITKLGG
ncbi:SCP2 domain-containing protein [Azoarcus olearius]|uniref:Ubiquinone biosynthesis accessory factor UbiJ n=1 Tax=Azoarcus sp. (strain BH72) TaxID=418699 RepID=A1K1S4_AZOSB|nr:SCP2 sterol-binding domain-containing protein [Azoarcus olearius]CAL92779.1 conserved hypothetical protein [Azoarcus olearius]